MIAARLLVPAAVLIGLTAATGLATPAASQDPELVAPGLVSLEDRNETFPAIDPVDGALWFSTYTSSFGDQTIHRAAPSGDTWSAAEVAPFSGEFGDRAPRFSPDGRRLYFTSNRPLDGVREFRIWLTERGADGRWGPPHPAAGLNADGRTIHNAAVASGVNYVASTRQGGLGRSDIFRIDATGAVSHLPAPINDALSQPDLWVSPDETWMILVITDHPEGLGGDDLYLARRQADGWSPPKNLGAPINSAEYEYGPSLSADRRYLYFTSHRAGSADIYRIPVAAIRSAAGH